MDAIDKTYGSCHPRTVWYIKEIRYVLQQYYGFSPADALDMVLTSPRLLGLVGARTDDEELFWHGTPLAWAYEEAIDKSPGIEPIDAAARKEYREKRFYNPPAEADI